MNWTEKESVNEILINGTDIDLVDIVKLPPEDQYNVTIKLLWKACPDIYQCLLKADNLNDARDAIFEYLEKVERDILYGKVDKMPLERSTIRVCIRILKSIISPVSEQHLEESSLKYLWNLAKGKEKGLKKTISVGFIMEFVSIFRGITGNSRIYQNTDEDSAEVAGFLELEGREAADTRTRLLDRVRSIMQRYLRKYPSGLEDDIILAREDHRSKILHYFNGCESDWYDHEWQTNNVIKEAKPLLDLIELTSEQQKAAKKISENKSPFGITPYYLSLIDPELSSSYDHAVRAQVIPPPDYVDVMVKNKECRGSKCDFMCEADTSPIDLITRRYPGIAILKPFNTCAQICVYCQRNWEIDEVLAPNALASQKAIKEAINWLDKHHSVGDVLITGGDPLIMSNEKLDEILDEIAQKDHVYRIRIGTRTPVVLPMRWTDDLVRMISKYNIPGHRQISIVTHFEHSYEITPDSVEAIRKIRKAGMNVYNQQVYTFENSRRFETVKLRLDLKSIGVDPYYNFNMKGKSETQRYMVPIARILQERKEEARLLPGLDRTDEPVFNLPKLGKNHLRAWQDHWIVMIKPNGSRIYEFHPWEKNMEPIPPYYFTDKPIYDYLRELNERGEDLSDYRNIWYYF